MIYFLVMIRLNQGRPIGFFSCNRVGGVSPLYLSEGDSNLPQDECCMLTIKIELVLKIFFL